LSFFNLVITTVCFFADGFAAAMDGLLFFSLAEIMVCFLTRDLGVATGFFGMAANLVVAIESFLLVDFDVTGVFLLLGLFLSTVVVFFE